MSVDTDTHWALRRTGTRPRLSDEQAAQVTRAEVLRRTGAAGAERADPWDPAPRLPDPGHDLLVAPGQPGAFATIQSAVEAGMARARATGMGGHLRIAIAPGRHKGLVYLPRAAVNGQPLRFTLTGLGATPAEVVIEDGIDAEMPGSEYSARFGAQFAGASPETRAIFTRIAARDTLSTANASVLRVEAEDTQLFNLTIRNSYGCDRADATPIGTPMTAQGFSRGQHQAVALLSAGADRLVLGHVHLKSFQDTLYLQSPDKRSTCRSFLFACDIEGDVDFIFGQSTAWFEDCTIRALGSRGAHCWLTAPSTHILTPWGFVFHGCRLTHDGSPRIREGRTNLGRQWFEGVRATPYGRSPVPGFAVTRGQESRYDPPTGTISDASLYSVGKCLWLSCAMGPHINRAAPWDDWSGPGYDTSGGLRPGDWAPRYRPVQTGAADMHRFLATWDDTLPAGPDFPWLGEHATTDLPDDLPEAAS